MRRTAGADRSAAQDPAVRSAPGPPPAEPRVATDRPGGPLHHEDNMQNMEKQASTRQLKVAREIQKDLAEILRRKGMAAFDGALVTVSEVRVSPDLSLAKTYVSIFPSEKARTVMDILNDNLKTYRGELGRLVAKQLRIVPEIVFHLDTTLDYAEHIDGLLNPKK